MDRERRATYRAIADAIAAEIESGQLGPGSAVPSQRDLMSRYGTSGITANRALGELRARGLVVIVPGRGAQVRRPVTVHVSQDGPWYRQSFDAGVVPWNAQRAAQGQRPAQTVLSVAREMVPGEIARRLDVPIGSLAVRRVRLLRVDGLPVELSSGWYPLWLAGSTRLETVTGPLRGGAMLAIERLGHPIARIVSELTIRQPTPDEAAALAMDPHRPVVHEITTTSCDEGRPVEVTDGALVADVHSFRFVIDVPPPVRG